MTTRRRQCPCRPRHRWMATDPECQFCASVDQDIPCDAVWQRKKSPIGCTASWCQSCAVRAGVAWIFNICILAFGLSLKAGPPLTLLPRGVSIKRSGFPVTLGLHAPR